METWFINQWKGKRKGEPGVELILIKMWNTDIFGIWLNFWAIDITIVGITVGIGITG